MSAAGARQLQDDVVLITAEGYDRLAAELERLRGAGRAELLERVRDARVGGDDADAVAVYDALNEQAQLERRIAALEELLAAARIAPPALDGRAAIGSRVTLRDLDRGDELHVHLVAGVEADPAVGRISLDAPVGRAIVGRGTGDVVAVEAPRGILMYEVLAVAPATEGAA